MRQEMAGSLADDCTIIDRLLAHIDHKTTDLSDGVWQEPVEHYRSADRLDAELGVFRRTPTIFCPSSALPEAGSWLARDAALTPILAVRGDDGVVRAFRNACRHRGVQLVEGTGCQQSFTCPYHAWTYGTKGDLRAVPHEYGFPGLEKDAYGLVPVATVEAHGLVYINQESGRSEERFDQVPDYFGPDWKLISTNEQEFDFNWKLFVDGLIEGYHIRATHAETFYPRQYDNINVIEYFGRNSRVSYPYRSIEKLREIPPEKRDASGAMTQVTLLFPNVSIATFPTHVSLSVIEPMSVDRTRVISYTLSTRPATDDYLSRRRDFVSAGTAEDRAVAGAVQRGLAARANEVFTFGLFEGALRHFHRNMGAEINRM